MKNRSRGALSGPSQPRQVDYAQLRRCRRDRRPHTYTGAFSLSAAVSEVCSDSGPAARIRQRPHPRQYADAVNELATSVHTVVCRVDAMLKRANAERQAAAISINHRGREINRLIAAAGGPPPPPRITPASLADGTWVTVLTNHAKGFDGPLSALLGRALAPGATTGLSVSEQLETVLREIDRAALALDRRLTLAGQRPPAKAPKHPKTPLEQREARRAGIAVSYDGGFDLVAELQAICGPLVSSVGALPDPRKAYKVVDGFVDSAHEAICEVVTLLARADAAARCRGVKIDQRGRARKLCVDLAPKPVAPIVTEQAVVSGRWVRAVVRLAEPYAAPLADLLRTAPPGPGPRGLPTGDTSAYAEPSSVNGSLLDALRIVDAAERRARRILHDAARRSQARPPAPDKDGQVRARAEAELRRLGVKLA